MFEYNFALHNLPRLFTAANNYNIKPYFQNKAMDEIVVGTYEGFLLGYSMWPDNEVTKLKQTFATQSHTASVRCLSVAGKYLASGGTDDKVIVIDLKTRKEHTVLMTHDGTINAIAFSHSGTHLITGCDDGSIIVTRTGSWQVEKIWKKAHGGQPVTGIAVHPSDKLALSIGSDKTLRTWNLVKGRPAFTINLSSKGVIMPTEIKFSPGGERFSLVSQQTVDVWTLSKAGLEKRITCNSKPTTVMWYNNEQMFVGLENGKIITVTMSDTDALTYKAHIDRVKCLHFENDMLYSASSSGQIKVWSYSNKKLQELCSTNASCRVTCIALNRQNHLVKNEGCEDVVNAETQNGDENSEDDSDQRQSPLKKRKVGAFVTISYDDQENDNSQDKGTKKTKKKLNKKSKNKPK